MKYNKVSKALLTAAVLAWSCTAVWAAGPSLIEKTNTLETSVYGSVQQGALAERVQRLDQALYGGTNTINADNMQAQTNHMYDELYENSGKNLSFITETNILEWKYQGDISDGGLEQRIKAMELGIHGKESTGALKKRLAVLRKQLLTDEGYTAAKVTVPSQVVIELKTLEEISSKTAREGDILNFAVAEDVVVDGCTVIPAGMKGTAKVAKARKAGWFGRNGKLELEFSSIRAIDGTEIPVLMGEKSEEEYKKAAGAVGASAAGALILGPVGLVGGLFVNGDNVTIPAGSVMYVETMNETEACGLTEASSSSAVSAAGPGGAVVTIVADEETPAVQTETVDSSQTLDTAKDKAVPVDLNEAAGEDTASSAAAEPVVNDGNTDEEGPIVIIKADN